MFNFWKEAIGLGGTAALATIILVLVTGTLRRFANRLMRSSKRPRRGELKHISGGNDALFELVKTVARAACIQLTPLQYHCCPRSRCRPDLHLDEEQIS